MFISHLVPIEPKLLLIVSLTTHKSFCPRRHTQSTCPSRHIHSHVPNDATRSSPFFFPNVSLLLIVFVKSPDLLIATRLKFTSDFCSTGSATSFCFIFWQVFVCSMFLFFLTLCLLAAFSLSSLHFSSTLRPLRLFLICHRHLPEFFSPLSFSSSSTSCLFTHIFKYLPASPRQPAW